MPMKLLWPIATDTETPMSQSSSTAETYSWRLTRENAGEQDTINLLHLIGCECCARCFSSSLRVVTQKESYSETSPKLSQFSDHHFPFHRRCVSLPKNLPLVHRQRYENACLNPVSPAAILRMEENTSGAPFPRSNAADLASRRNRPHSRAHLVHPTSHIWHQESVSIKVGYIHTHTRVRTLFNE